MIGYSCKYAPVELIAAYGEEALLLDAETADFSRAETLTHANVCCHAKALLTQALDTDELVLTDCCDATRRICDVLQDAGRQRFLFQFDLPHDDAACARARLTRELIRFADAYGAYTGRAFSKEAFFAACRNHSSAHPPREPFIAVLGARVSPQLLGQIRCAFPIPVENLTCSGLRTLEDPPEEADGFSFEALMDWYAGALLRQTPCMRMTDIASRRALYENENIRGIVYNTVKFCDYYGFEYADLKAKSAAALLKIESDYTLTAPGQLSTRLEAFRERLGLTAPDGGAGNQPKKRRGRSISRASTAARRRRTWSCWMKTKPCSPSPSSEPARARTSARRWRLKPSAGRCTSSRTPFPPSLRRATAETTSPSPRGPRPKSPATRAARTR